MYDAVIKFRKYVKTEKRDEYGDIILELVEREVFAEEKSVGMKEFYQAQSLGFKAEIKFELADYLDYEGEKELVYEGKVYKILRTYKKESNELEITCTGGVHDEHA